jgi:hypothetical protein
MNVLNDEQRKRVAAWIEEGLKLSDIQNRIASEFGVRLTYMDVRFLVDDLKLMPKDIERPKPNLPTATPPAPNTVSAPGGSSPATDDELNESKPAGRVSVSVDQIARAGTMVSGKVTFSDGNTAEWYFDATGRLGLVPQQQGYRPPQSDLQEFQMALERELSKMGY